MKYDSDEGWPNLSKCSDCWDCLGHTCQDERIIKLNGGVPREIGEFDIDLGFPDWCPLEDVNE